MRRVDDRECKEVIEAYFKALPWKPLLEDREMIKIFSQYLS